MIEDAEASNSLNEDDDDDEKHHRSKHYYRGATKNDREKKRKKRKRISGRSYSSDSDNSSDRRDRKAKKRKKKATDKKKEKRKKKEKDRMKSECSSSQVEITNNQLVEAAPQQTGNEQSKQIPPHPTQEARAAALRMVPMSREQYEAKRAEIREEYEPETGRTRLVRGTGEIIERIVSRSQHSAINQTATRGDGQSFSRNAYSTAMQRR